MRQKKDIADYTEEELLRDIEAWERINRIPDTRPLLPKQAAVLMTFSERTLQDWRKKGTGPVYFQNNVQVKPGERAPEQGTNLPIRYFKPDIEAWWRKNMTESVKQAQRLRGQTFIASILHLAEEAPFYVDHLGQIEGMVEDRSLGELLAREDADIQWMPVSEAASRTWADLDKHRELATKVKAALSDAVDAVDAGLAATDIASVSQEGRVKGPRK